MVEVENRRQSESLNTRLTRPETDVLICSRGAGFRVSNKSIITLSKKDIARMAGGRVEQLTTI